MIGAMNTLLGRANCFVDPQYNVIILLKRPFNPKVLNVLVSGEALRRYRRHRSFSNEDT